mgnify:CR=1 FL=1
MAKRSASGASKAPSKNNKKSSAPARGARQEEARRRGEVRGVLYVAAGILLGVYLFVSGTGVLGEFLSRLLFGLCGWFAYALPLVCIGAGVLSIAGRASGRSGTGWIVTGVIAALTLAEAARGAAYKGSPYLSYLAAAYEAGAAFPHRGGGAMGALLCYPLQQLGQERIIKLTDEANNEVSKIFSLLNSRLEHPISAYCDVNDDYSIMAMVESGLGVSILSELVTQRMPFDIRLKEFDPPQYRDVAIAVKKGRKPSPATEKFIQTVLEFFNKDADN